MKMKKLKPQKIRRRAAAVVAVAVMLTTQGSIVFAMNANDVAAIEENSQTSYLNSKESMDTEYVEWEDPSVELFEGDIINYARAGYSTFNWTVKPNAIIQSAGTYKEAGETLYVSAGITPGSSSVRVGIKKNDGMKRYVTGASRIQHTFEITQAGNYRVFVENKDDVTVTVNGGYR